MMSASEGATPLALHRNKPKSKDVKDIVQRVQPSKQRRRKRSSNVFDASKKTVRTHSNQRLSKRKRKNTNRMCLVSLHKLARKITQSKNQGNKVKTYRLFI